MSFTVHVLLFAQGKGREWSMFLNASHYQLQKNFVFTIIKFVDQSQELGWSLFCRFANGITELNPTLILSLQFWFEYEFLFLDICAFYPQTMLVFISLFSLCTLFYFALVLNSLDFNSIQFLGSNRCPIATWKIHGHKTVSCREYHYRLNMLMRPSK